MTRDFAALLERVGFPVWWDPAAHEKVMDKLKDTLAKTAAKGNGEAR